MAVTAIVGVMLTVIVPVNVGVALGGIVDVPVIVGLSVAVGGVPVTVSVIVGVTVGE